MKGCRDRHWKVLEHNTNKIESRQTKQATNKQANKPANQKTNHGQKCCFVDVPFIEHKRTVGPPLGYTQRHRLLGSRWHRRLLWDQKPNLAELLGFTRRKPSFLGPVQRFLRVKEKKSTSFCFFFGGGGGVRKRWGFLQRTGQGS